RVLFRFITSSKSAEIVGSALLQDLYLKKYWWFLFVWFERIVRTECRGRSQTRLHIHLVRRIHNENKKISGILFLSVTCYLRKGSYENTSFILHYRVSVSCFINFTACSFIQSKQCGCPI